MTKLSPLSVITRCTVLICLLGLLWHYNNSDSNPDNQGPAFSSSAPTDTPRDVSAETAPTAKDDTSFTGSLRDSSHLPRVRMQLQCLHTETNSTNTMHIHVYPEAGFKLAPQAPWNIHFPELDPSDNASSRQPIVRQENRVSFTLHPPSPQTQDVIIYLYAYTCEEKSTLCEFQNLKQSLSCSEAT